VGSADGAEPARLEVDGALECGGRDGRLARIYGPHSVPTIKLDIDTVLTTKYDARYPVSACYQPTKRPLLPTAAAAVAMSPPWSTSSVTVSLISGHIQTAINSPLFSTSYYSSHGSYRQRIMCRPLCGHGCTCVCLSVPRRIPTLLNGPGCNLGEWYRLSSSCAQLGGFAIGAWFRCYDNIAPNAKDQRVLVLALCLVFTARHNARIASAVLATAIPSVCPSVCLSICLSHAGIVSKRRHVARCSLHSWIAKCV